MIWLDSSTPSPRPTSSANNNDDDNNNNVLLVQRDARQTRISFPRSDSVAYWDSRHARALSESEQSWPSSPGNMNGNGRKCNPTHRVIQSKAIRSEESRSSHDARHRAKARAHDKARTSEAEPPANSSQAEQPGRGLDPRYDATVDPDFRRLEDRFLFGGSSSEEYSPQGSTGRFLSTKSRLRSG